MHRRQLTAIDTLLEHVQAMKRLIVDEIESQRHGLTGPVVEQILDGMCRTYASAVMQDGANEGLEGFVPATNAQVEGYVRAVRDGAHAAAEEREGPRLKCPCGYHGPIGDPGDACPSCGADDRGVEVVPPGAAVIDPETVEHVRAALAADGRAHDAQVKAGPRGIVPEDRARSSALVCDCVTGAVCPAHREAS